MTESCLCPTNYPDWHDQAIDLGNEATHTISTPAFMFMPLSYDLYQRKQQDEIERLELEEKWPGFVITRSGMLRGQMIRLLNTQASPARRFVHLAAEFKLYGHLHQGGIGTIKESTRALQNKLFDLGRMPKELYLCYLTCPICSEQQGGDKILLLRRWVESPTLTRRIKKRNSK